MVTAKRSMAEAETACGKSRGIWSLAETAAASYSGNVPSTRPTNDNCYFEFCPHPSLIIAHFSNTSSAHCRYK